MSRTSSLYIENSNFKFTSFHMHTLNYEVCALNKLNKLKHKEERKEKKNQEKESKLRQLVSRKWLQQFPLNLECRLP